VRVRFPALFDHFLASMEMLSPDLLRLVSFQCVISEGVSYHLELLATLLLPVVSVLALLLIAICVVRCTPVWAQADGVCSLLRAILGWPQVWDLGWWAFLVIYPTLARQTLSIFDCVPYEEHSLLRAQTDVHCYSYSWLRWAAAALAGTAVYCFGAPVGIIVAARRSDGGVRSSRRLTQVLMSAYRPKYAYWGGVDLLLRFVLTGVITVIEPQTRVQLWFGAVSSLVALQLHLRAQPFESPFCNVLQAAALLQLFFTYLTAFLFFVDLSQPQALDGENRYLGITLVVGNSLAYLLIFGSSIRGMLRMRRDMFVKSVLTWDDGHTPVQLRPPAHPNGWHCIRTEAQTFWTRANRC
jgi:hypothetical protein